MIGNQVFSFSRPWTVRHLLQFKDQKTYPLSLTPIGEFPIFTAQLSTPQIDMDLKSWLIDNTAWTGESFAFFDISIMAGTTIHATNPNRAALSVLDFPAGCLVYIHGVNGVAYISGAGGAGGRGGGDNQSSQSGFAGGMAIYTDRCPLAIDDTMLVISGGGGGGGGGYGVGGSPSSPPPPVPNPPTNPPPPDVPAPPEVPFARFIIEKDGVDSYNPDGSLYDSDNLWYIHIRTNSDDDGTARITSDNLSGKFRLPARVDDNTLRPEVEDLIREWNRSDRRTREGDGRSDDATDSFGADGRGRFGDGLEEEE